MDRGFDPGGKKKFRAAKTQGVPGVRKGIRDFSGGQRSAKNPGKKMSKKQIGCWAVTISCNHSELPTPEEMKATFNELTTNWCFQLERGSTAGKLHYQCRLLMDPKQYKATMLTVLSARKPYEIRDIDCDPESNNSIQQGGLAFYVMKDETRVDGPWYDSSYKVPKPKKVYEGNDLACMENPFKWQKWCIDRFSAPCNEDRDIIWIYNAKGCAGKSKLMKWMMYKGYDMARVPMGTATQIKTSIVGKGPKEIYLVDLPRVRGADERINEVFSALEEVKNGWVESAMYGKSDDILMEPPHVMVFSNEVPNMAMASPDRWKVYTLFKVNDDIDLRLMTTTDVASVYQQQMEEAHPNKRKRGDDDPAAPPAAN